MPCGSQEIADLGEVDSGAPETLVDFAVWAMTTFPAQHYALILSDHGAGWLGGWTDNAPNEGALMSVSEIDAALGEILAQTGVAQLDFLGFDACLMADVEALAGIAPHAAYAVASEETEPTMGWAYAEVLYALASNPAMTGAELATTVVDTYIVGDLTVQDTGRRAAFVASNFGVQEEVDPEELVAVLTQPVTLTAFDLSGTQALMAAIDDLALALYDVDPTVMAKARTYAQSFECVFGEGIPSPYLDLGSFAHLAAEIAGTPEMDAAVAAVDEAMGTIDPGRDARRRAARRHRHLHLRARAGAARGRRDLPGDDLLYRIRHAVRGGVALGRSARRGPPRWDARSSGSDTWFVDPSMRYADLSAWSLPLLERDGTLAPDDGRPGGTGPVAVPSVAVAPLAVSAEEVAADGSVTLSTQITGDDVGYIYVEVTLFDEETGSYILQDLDYVAADDTQSLNGVEYPVWTGRSRCVRLRVGAHRLHRERRPDGGVRAPGAQRLQHERRRPWNTRCPVPTRSRTRARRGAPGCRSTATSSTAGC